MPLSKWIKKNWTMVNHRTFWLQGGVIRMQDLVESEVRFVSDRIQVAKQLSGLGSFVKVGTPCYD